MNEELALLGRKRNELARSHSRTLHEAVIFADKTGNADTEIEVCYLVRNASWSPTYSLRSASRADRVGVEMGALATQTSGEDWESIALTLSTASAQLVADGPTLAPIRLHLSTAAQTYGGASGLEERFRSVKSKLRASQRHQQTAANLREQYDVQWGMNRAGEEMQQLELSLEPEDAAAVRKTSLEKGSGLAVSYTIEGRLSLASRRDSQMVRIAKLDMPVNFFYEATPLLTEQVYRYAEMVNDTETSLLEGLASVYLDGQFVGTANLPMVAQGQKVTVGCGTDPQLRAWREFVSKDSKDKLLGGTKVVRYAYRLVLENYGEKAVRVRALDRIPAETEAIKVKLSEPGDPLCTDPHYQRVYRPQGILRWDVDVPAHAARETARTIGYGFALEFDARLHIAPTPQPQPAAEQKVEFEEMFQQRMYAH
jgi:uncharacterized protein (TIGR02231 family)